MEAIKRQVEDGSQGEICREQDVKVEPKTVETDVRTAEEKMNDTEDSIGDTEGDLNEKHRAIVEHLKKIMVEGRTGSDIMFKKVDKKVLKNQIDTVNKAIKYLKSKSITATNNLIRAASVWVAERIGLKKAEHRKKNEPRRKSRTERNIKKLKKKWKFSELMKNTD